MKEHPAMPDPLQLAAALDFLAISPAPHMALSPATGQRRRFLLEDSGAALAFLASPDLPTPSPAQRAALEVFGQAAAVWHEYLLWLLRSLHTGDSFSVTLQT